MGEFRLNVYEACMIPDTDWLSKTGPDLVEQGMSKSVRETLEQYARTNQVIDISKDRFSYADEFDDREPLDSERINNLLDRPDYTGNSEMEMMDVIRENTTEVNLRDLQINQSLNEQQKSNKSQSSDSQKVTDNQDYKTTPENVPE